MCAARAVRAGVPGARPLPGPVATIGAAWVLSVGFDLLLHGGLLARLYLEAGPALLPPEEAFRRIPLGYAAFLVLTWALWWLLTRLEVRGALAGGRLGLLAGLVVWGALALGLFSITRMGPGMLAGWWLGQAAELALAGAVIGAAAAGASRRSLFTKVAVAFALCVATTVVLQSTGLAPAMRTVSGG